MQREKKAWGAALAGLIYGAVLGACIGMSFDGGQGAIIGALVVGAYSSAAEFITDRLRKPGKAKPLLHRVIGTVLMGAAAGAILNAFISPLATCVLLGLFFGLMSLGPRRLVMGIIIGIVVGVVMPQE